MEEIFAYALLFCEELITEKEYSNALDKLFLNTPENKDLLYLEWERDIKKSIAYIKTQIDYKNFDITCFGKALMSKLKVIYVDCADIRYFSERMYHLWKVLPENIQEVEPFKRLCYADDPLSWGDEKQTRNLCEQMLDFYKEEKLEEL